MARIITGTGNPRLRQYQNLPGGRRDPARADRQPREAINTIGAAVNLGTSIMNSPIGGALARLLTPDRTREAALRAAGRYPTEAPTAAPPQQLLSGEELAAAAAQSRQAAGMPPEQAAPPAPPGPQYDMKPFDFGADTRPRNERILGTYNRAASDEDKSAVEYAIGLIEGGVPDEQIVSGLAAQGYEPDRAATLVRVAWKVGEARTARPVAAPVIDMEPMDFGPESPQGAPRAPMGAAAGVAAPAPPMSPEAPQAPVWTDQDIGRAQEQTGRRQWGEMLQQVRSIDDVYGLVPMADTEERRGDVLRLLYQGARPDSFTEAATGAHKQRAAREALPFFPREFAPRGPTSEQLDIWQQRETTRAREARTREAAQATRAGESQSLIGRRNMLAKAAEALAKWRDALVEPIREKLLATTARTRGLEARAEAKFPHDIELITSQIYRNYAMPKLQKTRLEMWQQDDTERLRANVLRGINDEAADLALIIRDGLSGQKAMIGESLAKHDYKTEGRAQHQERIGRAADKADEYAAAAAAAIDRLNELGERRRQVEGGRTREEIIEAIRPQGAPSGSFAVPGGRIKFGEVQIDRGVDPEVDSVLQSLGVR